MSFATTATVLFIRRILCLLLCLPPVLAAAEDAKSGRLALVIGNNRYEPAIGALRNPVNDARAMGRTLRSLGFTVVEKHNVSRDALIEAVLDFRTRLRGADVGLFYFAGHGISVGGSNYLLPVRSNYSPESTEESSRRLLAETRLVNAEQIVAEMTNTNSGCNLVILDACRVTPAARNPVARDAARNGGLVEMNPPAGSLIAFSTDAGRVASDGDAANGLYTSQLIKHLQTPGLTIEQVFKRTRSAVITRSSGAQVPAEYSRLVGEDIFLAGKDAAGESEPVAPKARPIPLPTSAEIQALAAKGDIDGCLQALRHVRRAGNPVNAAKQMSTLLDQVKESLRDPAAAKPRAESLLRICTTLLCAIEEFVPNDASDRRILEANAYNRRGDSLLLLGKSAEALEAYDAALSRTPGDAYVIYNRGMALLQLDRKEEAKAEFQKVLNPKSKQPGARKLATEALSAMK